MKLNDHLQLLKKIKTVEPPVSVLPEIKKRISLDKSNQILMTWSWTIAAAAILILCINLAILIHYQRMDSPPKIEQLASSMWLSSSNELYYE